MDSHMEELKDIPTKTQKRETTEQLLPVRMKPIMGIEEIMEELEPSMSIDEKKRYIRCLSAGDSYYLYKKFQNIHKTLTDGDTL